MLQAIKGEQVSLDHRWVICYAASFEIWLCMNISTSSDLEQVYYIKNLKYKNIYLFSYFQGTPGMFCSVCVRDMFEVVVKSIFYVSRSVSYSDFWWYALRSYWLLLICLVFIGLDGQKGEKGEQGLFSFSYLRFCMKHLFNYYLNYSK